MTLTGRVTLSFLLSCGVVAFVAPAVRASAYPNPTQETGVVDVVALGDFNGDGRQDALLGANLVSQDLRIALGTGDGTFGPPFTIQTGTRIGRLAAADFDRDGRLDIAALAYDQVLGTISNVRVEVFRGHGDGSFDTPVVTATSTTSTSYSDMTVGDINNDGAPDVVTINGGGFMSLCRLLNSGTGILSTAACQSIGGGQVRVAEFNEDGRPDVAIVVGGNIQIWFGTPGGGAFSGGIDVISNLPEGIGLFKVTDLNHDGHADMLYVLGEEVGQASGRVGILFGDGSAAFPSRITVPGASCCAALEAADVDGDGILDLLTAGSWQSSYPGITVDPGLAGGGFGPAWVLASAGTRSNGGGIHSMALGYLDGDARPDLAAGVGPGGGLRSYLGTPGGRFGMTSLGTGAGTEVASADMNADGHKDLVVLEGDSNRVSVLLSHGDGTFDPPLRFPCGTTPLGLALGDFNGDGRIDAVTALSGSLALLYGNGDGTLAPPLSVPGGGLHTDVVAGDFNGDGKLDLATADQTDATVSVFYNISNAGTFDRGYYAAGYRPFAIATGDVDGDGVLDLVVGTIPYSGGDLPSPKALQGLGILHGESSGFFELPTFLTWPGFTIQIADVLIADLNGDGSSDLAAANGDKFGDVTVFLNQGLGAFGSSLHLLAGMTTSPVTLTAADFDGDGRVDLAVGNIASADIAVFSSDSAGGFEPPVRFGTATPAGLATGDFNEDGAVDFALATPDGLASVVLRAAAGAPEHDPIADAGVDRTGECGAAVLLDGSGSSDADSTPGTHDDIVLFSWYENYGQPSQTSLGTGVTLSVVLGLGQHVVTLKVTDRTGRTGTDDVLVTIADTLPPSGIVALTPSALWPPNHRMVDVSAQVTAADQCGGPVNVTLQSVLSSEPDDAPGGADGNTTGDIAGVIPDTPDDDFSLRAERSNTGPGRTYTVTYRLTDARGRGALVSGAVTVSHDNSGITDPITLSVSIASGGDIVIAWNAIPGVSHYDVAAGLLTTLVSLDQAAGDFPPACIADQLPADMTSFQFAGDPEPGEVYFFLVDYVSYTDATGGRSGYGSESGPFDLQPVVPVDICP
jgi:hypothetical protein